MVQFETSVGPLADLSEARWTRLVSGVIRWLDFSVKNEKNRQRVKRRRVMRKCHLDGVSVPKEPGRCGIYDL